jgi:hypothetical protein
MLGEDHLLGPASRDAQGTLKVLLQIDIRATLETAT